jgi:hypothetical protein
MKRRAFSAPRPFQPPGQLNKQQKLSQDDADAADAAAGPPDAGAEPSPEPQQGEAAAPASRPPFPAQQRKPFLCRSNAGAPQPLLAAPKPKPPAAAAGAAGAAAADQPSAASAASASSAAGKRFFAVLYTKREKLKKKNDKGFQDGVLELVSGAVSTLYDTVGRLAGSRQRCAGRRCACRRPQPPPPPPPPPPPWLLPPAAAPPRPAPPAWRP